ncbi:MAG: VWA domain-containing protein [Nocardioides sp.]
MATTRFLLIRATALALIGLLFGLALGLGAGSAQATAPADTAPADTAPADTAPADKAPDDADTDYGRMLLILDSSGSMSEPASGGTTKIAAAKDALGRVVETLPDEAYVGLRVYGATVFSRDQPGACRDSQLAVPPGVDNREELTAAISSYQAFGETPIGYALRQAASDIGGEGTRSIVLVSDGVATCDPDPCEVAAELAEKGIDLQINVVGLDVDESARSQLRCIAAAGNGTYYDADSADEIAESLVTVSERALRPFGLEGMPIEGGPSSIEATPVTAGQWVDTVGGRGAVDAERWFEFERTIADSTVQVGVTTLGATGASSDYIGLKLTTEDGAACGGASDLKQLTSGQLLGTGLLAGSGTSADSEGCNGERLLIAVDRDFVVSEGSAPYALKIVEEPPATNVESLPERLASYDAEYVAPKVSGSVTDVVGGSSFGDAVELTDGRYAGTIVPGETQVFKVRVEYGQSLATRLLTPSTAPDLREVLGIIGSGPLAGLQVFNPMRMGVDYADGSEPNGTATADTPGSLTFATTEVRYRNRESSELAAMDGYYYLVYGADSDDGQGYEMPYELQVEVQGSAGGSPTYADGEEVQGLAPTEPTEPTEQPGDEPTDVEATADEGLSTPVKVAAVSGLGGLALACLIGALLLVRRPRRLS